MGILDSLKRFGSGGHYEGVDPRAARQIRNNSLGAAGFGFQGLRAGGLGPALAQASGYASESRQRGLGQYFDSVQRAEEQKRRAEEAERRRRMEDELFQRGRVDWDAEQEAKRATSDVYSAHGINEHDPLAKESLREQRFPEEEEEPEIVTLADGRKARLEGGRLVPFEGENPRRPTGAGDPEGDDYELRTIPGRGLVRASASTGEWEDMVRTGEIDFDTLQRLATMELKATETWEGPGISVDDAFERAAERLKAYSPAPSGAQGGGAPAAPGRGKLSRPATVGSSGASRHTGSDVGSLTVPPPREAFVAGDGGLPKVGGDPRDAQAQIMDELQGLPPQAQQQIQQEISELEQQGVSWDEIKRILESKYGG